LPASIYEKPQDIVENPVDKSVSSALYSPSLKAKRTENPTTARRFFGNFAASVPGLEHSKFRPRGLPRAATRTPDLTFGRA